MVSFDPIRDFVPIATVASTELVLVVGPGTSANTLAEFIALAKAKPGQLNYASDDSSSATHLAGEVLATTANIKIQHVPYQGLGPAVTDLLGGQVPASFQMSIVALPYLKSGRLRGQAVSGESRMQSAPQVPTFTEGEALDEVVITNTIPLSQTAQNCIKIRQISVAPLIAETIQRIASGESVMRLFSDQGNLF